MHQHLQMSFFFRNFVAEMHTRDMTTREIANMISARVHQNEPTAKVMLFGSRARGTARPDSDWDVIILLDDNSKTNKWDAAVPLYNLSWEIDELINPIVYTQSDWEKRSFTPFYKNVMHDGIEL